MKAPSLEEFNAAIEVIKNYFELTDFIEKDYPEYVTSEIDPVSLISTIEVIEELKYRSVHSTIDYTSASETNIEFTPMLEDMGIIPIIPTIPKKYPKGRIMNY